MKQFDSSQRKKSYAPFLLCSLWLAASCAVPDEASRRCEAAKQKLEAAVESGMVDRKTQGMSEAEINQHKTALQGALAVEMMKGCPSLQESPLPPGINQAALTPIPLNTPAELNAAQGEQ